LGHGSREAWPTEYERPIWIVPSTMICFDAHVMHFLLPVASQAFRRPSSRSGVRNGVHIQPRVSGQAKYRSRGEAIKLTLSSQCTTSLQVTLEIRSSPSGLQYSCWWAISRVRSTIPFLSAIRLAVQQDPEASRLPKAERTHGVGGT
jgi:hypothetical protein